MAGRIASGDLVTVVPRGNRRPQKGDIVLCKVKGRQYLHLVIGGGENRDTFLIGNNRGRMNGWTNLSHIYGFCTQIEP